MNRHARPQPEPVCGTAHRQSCSWCGELNRVYANAPTYCGCGHRGDLPVSACDCETCRYARFATEFLESDPE